MSKKRYYLVNDNDGNDQIDLQAVSEDGAREEALEVLGWSLCSKDEKDE